MSKTQTEKEYKNIPDLRSQCHLCPLTQKKCDGDCMWAVNIKPTGFTCAINALVQKLGELSYTIEMTNGK